MSNTLENNNEIFKELSFLLKNEDYLDPDSISLYDINELINNNNDMYYYYYQEKSQNMLNNYLAVKKIPHTVYIYDFDYQKNELPIGISNKQNDYDETIIIKNNDKLEIKQSNSPYAKKLLNNNRIFFEELFNKFLKLKAFFNESVTHINSSNSNFLVNINCYGIDIVNRHINNFYMQDFTLSTYYIDNLYDCETTNKKIIKLIKRNKNDILKKIYVKIDDCPSWSKIPLYNLRKKQLTELSSNKNKIKRKSLHQK